MNLLKRIKELEKRHGTAELTLRMSGGALRQINAKSLHKITEEIGSGAVNSDHGRAVLECISVEPHLGAENMVSLLQQYARFAEDLHGKPAITPYTQKLGTRRPVKLLLAVCGERTP